VLWLRRSNRVRTIHGALAIKGNTLSKAQITAIPEGKRMIAPPRKVWRLRSVETVGTPFGQKKLGRKHIKSFASGIAHMFACAAQHYAWLAYQFQLPTATIDLLELRIEPAEFDIERNRILAGMCQKTLLRNVGQLAPPGAVASAVLFARFGIHDYSKDGRSASIGSSVFTVILTDERGKQWRVDHVEERMLIDE
jgi:hypothetical protein